MSPGAVANGSPRAAPRHLAAHHPGGGGGSVLLFIQQIFMPRAERLPLGGTLDTVIHPTLKVAGQAHCLLGDEEAGIPLYKQGN